MRKVIIILSVFALIEGGCRQAAEKQLEIQICQNKKPETTETLSEDIYMSSVVQAQEMSNSLEDIIIKTIKAYQNKDEETLNNFILKDFGIAFLYKRGAHDNVSISNKMSFVNPVPEYLHYNIYFKTNYKINFEELPVFSCENEEWNKAHGIYCDTINIDKTLSTIVKNENEYLGLGAIWSEKEIYKFEEIEKKSHKIIVVGKEKTGEFIFYLTFIKNKWYLTIIDRFEACSA